MSFTVKAYLIKDLGTDEIRRFAVDQDVSTSHTYLREKITQIFPGLKNKNFDLFWKDAEGDMIAFSSDEEQMEALGFVTDTVFKVYIKHKEEAEPAEEPSSDEKDTFHPGVVCDGCDGPIHGCRYKCTECADYDLCTTCKDKGLHNEHVLMAIQTPIGGGWMGFGFMPPFHHGHPPPPPHHGHPPPPFGEMPDGPAGPWGPQMFGPGFFGPWGRGRGGPGWRRTMKKCWKKWAEGEESNEKDKPEDGQKKDDTKPKAKDTDSSSDEGDHSSTEDYLKNIGANVAAMLDPLGIDVEVDVEHGGRRRRFDGQGPWAYMFAGGRGGRCGRGRGGRCPRRSPPSSRPTQNTKPDNAQQKESQKQQPEKMKEQTAEEHKSEKDVEMETGEAVGAVGNLSDYIVTTETPQDTETGEAGAEDKAKDGEKPADKEWTIIEGATGTTPDSTQAPSTGIYPQVDEPTEPHTPVDPAIANALDHMRAMGFTNEGGWLTTLLQVTKGDINKALDAIRANRKL